MQVAPLIFGCEGLRVSPQELAFFSKSQPFGFILFARNLDNPYQIRTLCAALREAVGWKAPIMIDQEGGRVARLGAPHWFEFPAALDQANHVNCTRLFWLRGRLIAENLYSSGIDVNCAPLGDIARPNTHTVLRSRCYGFDKATVISNASAMNLGLCHGGVSGVLKHIPGHGRAQLDSHMALPLVSATKSDLAQSDFDVFRKLNHISMGMTAHLVYQDIDPMHPATHSKIMIDLIRNNIRFDGLLMTDDISMKALKGGMVARAHKAWHSGCDLVLHCNANFREMQILAEISEPVIGQTLQRVEHMIMKRPKPVPVDIQQLKAELISLMNE